MPRYRLVSDWTKPFDRVVGLLLFVALICFGVVIGLSLGFFSRELEVHDEWLPIFAAVFAAVFGVCIALYLDDRKRRRDLQGPVNEVQLMLYQFERALSRLEISVKWDALRAQNGERPDFRGVRNTMKEAAELAEKIPTGLISLPHAAIVQVRHARKRLWAGIEVHLKCYVDKLEKEAKREGADFGNFIDEDDDEEMGWELVKKTLGSLQADLTAIETYLARLL